MRYQYQGAHPAPPPPTITAIAGNVANSIGTYYFWLIVQNRAGFSAASERVSAIAAPGGGLALTIPASARPGPLTVGGEDLYPCDCRDFVIIFSPNTDPSDAIAVASYPGYTADGVTPTALPFTINLTEDEHLSRAVAVQSLADLPSNPSRGMRRAVDESGAILKWTGIAWEPVHPQTLTPFVSSPLGVGGCDRDLALLDDPSSIICPEYGLDGGNSEPVRYWLVNDTSAAIPQSRQVAFSLSATIQGVDVDLSLLPGFLGTSKLRFLGYVNTLTGALDISGPDGEMAGVGEELPYGGPTTGLTLPKDLEPNWAYLLEFIAATTVEQLNGRIPQGTTLKLAPALYDNLATLNPVALLTGSIILGDQERRRIVPGSGLQAIARPGSGLLRLPGGLGFSFWGAGEDQVVNLLPNTPGQRIAINVNGDCIVVGTVPAYAGLRAIAGTLDGTGQPSAWRPVTLSNSVYLDITVTSPGTIRANYPDVIAGMAAPFNADLLRIYVRDSGGTITYWDSAIALGAASQVHRVGGVAGTALGMGELPTPSDPAFGLFEVEEFSHVTPAGSSVFFAGAHEYAIALLYDDTITNLTHSEALGCLPEAEGGMAELFQLLAHIGPPVSQVGHIRSIPVQQRRAWRQVFCAIAGNNYRWNASENSVQDMDYLFRADPGDPELGELALNNVDPALVTEIWFNYQDRGGELVATVLNQVFANTYVRLDTAASSEVWATYQALSVPVLTGGIYTLPVAYLSGAGEFTDAALTVLSTGNNFVRPYDLRRSQAGRWTLDDSTQIHGVSGLPFSALGESGDWAFSIDPLLPEYGEFYQKVSGAWVGPLASILSYSLTSADYIQPAAETPVAVTVRSNQVYVVGGAVLVEGSGYFLVTGKIGGNQLEIEPYSMGAIAQPGATVPAGAKVLPSGVRGVTGATGAGVNPRGVYDPLVTYPIGDSVSSGGSSYVAIAITTGNAPPNATYWQLLAGQGIQGVAATIAVGTVTTAAAGQPATVANAGTPQDAVFNIGIPQGIQGVPGAALNPRGVYDPLAIYAIRDSVSLDGASYVATAPGTGNAPPNATYWQLLAEKGTPGVVSGASGLILEQQVAIASTLAGQIAVGNIAGVLQARPELDGAALTFAFLGLVQAFTKAQRAVPVALSIAAGVVAIDANLSNIFTLTLTANVTSVTLSNLAPGSNFDLHITQDATGGRTITGWVAAFDWAGGTAPTITAAANAKDFMSFESAGGATVKGFWAGNFS